MKQSWVGYYENRKIKKAENAYNKKIKNSFNLINTKYILKIFNFKNEEITPFFLNEQNLNFLNYNSLETQEDYEFYNGANNTQDGVYFRVTSSKKKL